MILISTQYNKPIVKYNRKNENVVARTGNFHKYNKQSDWLSCCDSGAAGHVTVGRLQNGDTFLVCK